MRTVSVAAALWCAPLSAQGVELAPDVLAMFAAQCHDCHSGRDAEAGFDLAALPTQAEAHVLARLLRVRDKVRTAAMPPAGQGELTAAERARIVAWIEDTVRARAGGLPTAAPGATIRRLSRGQIAAVLRDLFGVASPLVAQLPADDLGYGFDTVADAQSFSALHFEKFLALAEDVAAQVVDTEDPDHPAVRRAELETLVDDRRGVSADGDFANFYSRGDAEWAVALPRDGVYLLRVRACGDQAGDAAPRLDLHVDGRAVGAFDFPEERDAPAIRELRLELAGGRRRVTVGFANDFYDPQNVDPRRRDRNLRVDWLELHGPIDRRTPPEGSAWWLRHDRPRARPAERARAMLTPLVERAWRRPVTPATLDDLVRIVRTTTADGGTFAAGLRTALVAVLVAPSFLFRVDAAGRRDDVPARYELAARLSFLMWSSVPDAELLVAARAGALGDPARRNDAVSRMLADPRAAALSAEFAPQWLELRTLREVMPDPERFPGVTPTLLGDMQRETELLFDAIRREGRDVRDLLDAEFTFLNARLAAHYGYAGIEGDEFRRVAVPDARRRGVLGHASVLTLTSNPTRTSVVKRGKWVLENLLADPPPPPPPGTAFPEEAELGTAADLRAQMALHRREATCAACHARMDGLGFALERLDAVGRWRESDPLLDDRGELPGGRTVVGLEGLRALLRDDPAFLRAVALRLFVYAVGRPPDDADAVRLEAMVLDCAGQSTVTFDDLVRGIVEHPAFLRAR